jgi:hypothetical protein
MPDPTVPVVSVWIRNEAAFRLTSFESTAEPAKGPEAYVVLTDPVNLTSDLRRFTGRLLAIPNSLFRPIVGFHNDPESFIESFKHCPYSSLSGRNARLLPEELETLLYDYIFLRTEQFLFDVSSFEIQCRRAIAIACQDSLSDERLKTGVTSILHELVSYFRTLTENKHIPEPFAPKQSMQIQKLLILPLLSDLLVDSQRSFSATASDLRRILLDHLNTYRLDSHIDSQVRDYLNITDDSVPWFATIYYLITSGFRDSHLAPARQERAKDVDAASASHVVSPRDARSERSLNSQGFSQSSQFSPPPLSVVVPTRHQTASDSGMHLENDEGDIVS